MLLVLLAIIDESEFLEKVFVNGGLGGEEFFSEVAEGLMVQILLFQQQGEKEVELLFNRL